MKALLSNKFWGFDAEDNAVVIMKNDNDQLAILNSSSFLKHMFQLDVILEQGYKTARLAVKNGKLWPRNTGHWPLSI